MATVQRLLIRVLHNAKAVSLCKVEMLTQKLRNKINKMASSEILNLERNELKRFLKKDIRSGYTKDSLITKVKVQRIGISNSDVTSSLDKLLSTELLEILRRANKQVTDSGEEVTGDIFDMLIDILSNRIGDILTAISCRENHDEYSCNYCWELIYNPISLQCGHSYCQRCVPKLTHCKTCNTKINKDFAKSTNVGLTSILGKVHAMEYVGRSLSNEGDKLLEKKLYQDALQKYLDAMDFIPHSHSATLNRAKAFKELGNLDGAVQDVKGIKTFTRNTTEAHFVKGEILLEAKHNDDALISFLAAIAVDQSNTRAMFKAKELLENKLVSKKQSILTEEEFLKQISELSDNDDEPSCAKRFKCDDVSANLFPTSQSQSNTSEECVITTILRDLESSIFSQENIAKCLNLKEKEIKESHIIRTPDGSTVDASDFECSLCMRVYLDPVCTPCGHMYCLDCIERWLDHGTECPLCKSKMSLNISGQKVLSPNVDRLSKTIIQQVLPIEYEERVNLRNEEKRDLKLSTPIFVCTLAYPSIPCPLHIFEPRYRLLLRRAMDIHDKQFGICVPSATDPFHSYGTMVRIRNVSFFPDGRSVVDSVGSSRFRVLNYDKTDGYDTSVIEYLEDEQPKTEHEKDLLERLSQLVYNNATEWFKTVQSSPKELIKKHFGEFPAKDNDEGNDGPKWLWWTLAVLPVDEKIKLLIFSKTLLKERLMTVHRILSCLAKKAAANNNATGTA